MMHNHPKCLTIVRICSFLSLLYTSAYSRSHSAFC